MRRPEQILQRACVEVLTYCVPKPPEGPMWTAINPVPAKSKAVAGISKAMGLRAGVPDLLMIFRALPVLVEFKAGASVSKSQRDMHGEILAAGGVVRLARSVDEFIKILGEHGIPCRVGGITNGEVPQDRSANLE